LFYEFFTNVLLRFILLNKFLISAGLIFSVTLSGCGGRDANPVSVTHHTDRTLDCASVAREFKANERQIVKLIEERNSDTTKNIIAGRVGATIFFPALFFMDLGNEEKVEIVALRNCNKVLSDIARSKGCPRPKSRLNNVYQNLDSPPRKANHRSDET
jgi:hypothetical protein